MTQYVESGKKELEKKVALDNLPHPKKHKSKRDSVSLPTVEESKQQYTLELPPARMTWNEPTKPTHLFSERYQHPRARGSVPTSPMSVPSLQIQNVTSYKVGGADNSMFWGGITWRMGWTPSGWAWRAPAVRVQLRPLFLEPWSSAIKGYEVVSNPIFRGTKKITRIINHLLTGSMFRPWKEWPPKLRLTKRSARGPSCSNNSFLNILLMVQNSG